MLAFHLCGNLRVKWFDFFAISTPVRVEETEKFRCFTHDFFKILFSENKEKKEKKKIFSERASESRRVWRGKDVKEIYLKTSYENRRNGNI
jgi:hypothetical protein